MAERKAHKLEDKERTKDIEIEEDVDFGAMFLSDDVLGGLKAAGFLRPSPIQLAAIPLGRCGLDLVVQAKSGTGKTCVFTVVALEMVSVSAPTTQVLVLAPTREVAVQITQVMTAVASTMPSLRAATFIGGINLSQDRAKLRCCHIAVGTPGRVTQLVKMGLLKLDNVRLFVLDEADQLLSGQFTDTVIKLASGLPLNKQVLALSATYTEEVAKVAEELMRSPSHVRLGRECPSLLGVGQFVMLIPYHHQQHRVQDTKFSQLLAILGTIIFNQCLVFSNSQLRAESICNKLRASGWPVSHMTGGQSQNDRLAALDALCSYKCRVLVSTDLAARGLDSEHVNLVVNLDLPSHQATYLHRVGRAGRFGSRGAAITLATEGEEWQAMRAITTLANVRVQLLQDDWPSTLTQQVTKDAEQLEFLPEEEVTQWLHINATSQNKKISHRNRDLKDEKKSPPHQERAVNGKDSRTSEEDSEDSGKENREVNRISRSKNKTNCSQDRKIDKIKPSNSSGNEMQQEASSCKIEMKNTAGLKKKQCKKKRKDEEGKKIAELKKKMMKKKDDYNTVVNMLQGLDFSAPSINVSYTDILSDIMEKYDKLLVTEDSQVEIPPLPNKLKPSEDDLKALEDYCRTIHEDLDQRTCEVEKAWTGSKVDIHAALQAMIEGKDPLTVMGNDGKGETESHVEQDEAVLDDQVLSQPSATGHEKELKLEISSGKESDHGCRQVEQQSLETSSSYINSTSKNELRGQASVRKKLPRNNNEPSLQNGLHEQDHSAYDYRSRETELSSKKLVRREREVKRKQRKKHHVSESSEDETYTRYYADNTQYHNNTQWPGWEQYTYPAHQYVSHQYPQGTGNENQYQYTNPQAPTGTNSNYYHQQDQYPQGADDQHNSQAYMGYKYPGNYWSGQPTAGNYNQYSNSWDASHSWYQQQNPFVESACKFASMMEYVQTMGRMSARIAHDFYSRKSDEKRES